MIYEEMNTSIICIQCSCSKMYSVKQLSEKNREWDFYEIICCNKWYIWWENRKQRFLQEKLSVRVCVNGMYNTYQPYILQKFSNLFEYKPENQG